MYEMTTRERFQRMYEHRDADRVPIIGGPWGTTLERWRREGMPADIDFADHFGLDHVVGVGGDVSRATRRKSSRRRTTMSSPSTRGARPPRTGSTPAPRLTG